eukprot:4969561-Prymnesium_polylepis.1
MHAQTPNQPHGRSLARRRPGSHGRCCALDADGVLNARELLLCKLGAQLRLLLNRGVVFHHQHDRDGIAYA